MVMRSGPGRRRLFLLSTSIHVRGSSGVVDTTGCLRDLVKTDVQAERGGMACKANAQGRERTWDAA
jgi:hypothetical protein